MYVTRHAQIIQNNKLAISLQYFKEKVNHEIDFLCVDKHEILLKIDTMILIGMVKYSQSFQNASSLCSISKKKLDEVNSLLADKHKSFLQDDFSTLWIKVSYTVIIDNQAFSSTQNIKFAISLYFKKKVRDGVHFLHADKN